MNNRLKTFATIIVTFLVFLAIGFFIWNSRSQNIKSQQNLATSSENTAIASSANIASSTQASSTISDNITIVIGGDVMLARSIGEGILAGIDPFEGISSIFHDADYALINLECVVSDTGSGYPGKLYTFQAPEESISYLKDSGIDMVSLANNHSGDYGIDAFTDMLHLLSTNNIEYIGGGANEQETYSANVVDFDGTKVAFLAFSNVETPYFQAIGDSPGLAWIDQAKAISAIERAEAQAEITIVFNHWGTEYNTEFNASQQSTAYWMIDAGADLIVGGHSHVRQGEETYNGKKIYYSLGNLVFDLMQSFDASHGNLLKISITDREITNTELVPIEMSHEGYPVVVD